MFAAIAITAFSVQMVVWRCTRTTAGIGMGAPFGQAIVAIAAAVLSWKEKPAGYVLVVLLCALQNISGAMTYYSQSAPLGYLELLDLALAGLPFTAGMLAGIVLLLQHYRSPKIPSQSRDASPPTIPVAGERPWEQG